MTELPQNDLDESISPVLAAAHAAEDLDHAKVLADVINLYHDACRRTRMSTVLGADDINKIFQIFNLLISVGEMERGFERLVGRPQRPHRGN
jgi:hypothetical protein